MFFLRILLGQTDMDDLPRFSKGPQRLSLKGQIDPPRISDVEQEELGCHPLDSLTRFQEDLVRGVPVFCDSNPGQFAGVENEMIHLACR